MGLVRTLVAINRDCFLIAIMVKRLFRGNSDNAYHRRYKVRFVRRNNYRNPIMLYTIIVILLVLWLLGLIGHIGGGLINLLLVVALIVFIYNLIVGRRNKL
jgi:hypothetical protein